MKEKFIKWMPFIALTFFVTAVFLIADGHFWNGIVFIGAGASLSSATAIYKKNNASDEKEQSMKKVFLQWNTGQEETLIMNDYIAYCGLDCETCEARLATVNNDNELRIKVSKEWSELNGVEITPEMINCSGCRIPGVKTVYCDSLCPIRQCAKEKQMETCGGCPEMKYCEKVGAIIGNNPDARDRLEIAGSE